MEGTTLYDPSSYDKGDVVILLDTTVLKGKCREIGFTLERTYCGSRENLCFPVPGTAAQVNACSIGVARFRILGGQGLEYWGGGGGGKFPAGT